MLHVIKMNNDKSLVTTIKARIYQKENSADTIVFLIPKYYEDNNMADCLLMLRYILPNNVGRSEELELEPEPYNDSYYRYHLKATTQITSEVGKIELWLSAININDVLVLKTGQTTIEVLPVKDITNYFPDEKLDQLDKLEAKLNFLETMKADNIVFNHEDDTIQLTSDGVPVGDRIHVSACDCAVGISDAKISNGELIIIFDDGTTKNLGSVIGKDGAVVVPHISDNKILSFTIEDCVNEVPEPVDLNPFDEWSQVDDSEIETDYIWEEI